MKIDYVDLTPDEFDAKLSEHMTNLQDMFAQGEKLQASIMEQLKGLRYE